MAQERQKLTKAELEEDRFLEWILEAAEYVKARAQLFIGLAVGLVVVAVVVNLLLQSQKDAKLEAEGLLGKALISEQTSQPEQTIELCQRLLREYAGTEAAGKATVVLANRYFDQAKFAEANQLYQSYLNDYGSLDILVYAAWSGLASCLEAENQLVPAADKYRDFAQTYPDNKETSLALWEAARCYGLAGDRQQQQALLERLSQEYRDLPVGGWARQEIKAF